MPARLPACPCKPPACLPYRLHFGLVHSRRWLHADKKAAKRGFYMDSPREPFECNVKLLARKPRPPLRPRQLRCRLLAQPAPPALGANACRTCVMPSTGISCRVRSRATFAASASSASSCNPSCLAPHSWQHVVARPLPAAAAAGAATLQRVCHCPASHRTPMPEWCWNIIAGSCPQPPAPQPPALPPALLRSAASPACRRPTGCW